MITGIFTLILFVTIGAAAVLETKDPVIDVDNKCLAGYGITDGWVLPPPEIKIVDSRLYCVGACIYRKMGVMMENGIIDTAKAEKTFLSGEYREKELFLQVHNACRADNIGCELVKCMFKNLETHSSDSVDPPKSRNLLRFYR